MTARWQVRRLSDCVLYRALPSWLAVRLLESVCLVRGHRWSDFFGYESCDFCGKRARS